MVAQEYHMIVTVAILAVTVAFFIFSKLRTDIVALCALLALVITGVLETKEAFSGFANSVIFVAAGMFVISGAIVRSGLASAISKKILGVAGKNTNILFMLIMFLAAAIGSLVSNTGTVAIMMPIVVSLALSIEESPGRFLMPLAFMSSIGGMFTLIGNSPNMVVNDAYVKAGYTSLKLFSFLPVGIICFFFGMLVLAPLTSWYLSRRKNAKGDAGRRSLSPRDLANKYHLDQNVYRMTVPAGSELEGKPLLALGLPEKYGIVVQDVSRPERPQGRFHFNNKKMLQIVPGPDTVIMAGDVISVIGTREGVDAMGEHCGLDMAAQEEGGSSAFRFVSTGICELVLMSASKFINRTVEESGLRREFGLTVLGIQRGDRYLLENIKDQALQAGDALLVQGTWDRLTHLDRYGDWVVVGRPSDHAHAGRLSEKMPLVVTVLVLMILAMALNLVPTVVAVVLAAVVLVFGGCYKNADEAYSVISWETLVLIAGLLPIALAMEKTGVVGSVSGHMVDLCRNYGPHVALAVVYGAASLMNIFISTTPVALLVAPVAIQTAESLGYDPLPFLFAVATAASMCFASPFSTPSNALVMSAGRYTFLDYMKIGLPLQILMGIVMVIALPLLFPFNPA